MGHGDELKVTIEDTKNFVRLKVNRRNVSLDLNVGCCKAKAQISIVGHQQEQMLGNRSSVPPFQGAYRDNEALMGVIKTKRCCHPIETVRAWASPA